MSRDDTTLLVVDVQEKIIRLLPDHPGIIWNIRRLLSAAATLNVTVLATEQYPKGLGGTVADLAEDLKAVDEKLTFSCAGCDRMVERLQAAATTKVLVVGIETHVCVQQTVLDLLADGLNVYVAADAVGARREIDHMTALRRMDSAGATLTTAEAAMFEWCQIAGTPEFKRISALVRQSPPG